MPVGEAVGSGDVQEVPLKERGVNGAAMRDDGFFFATDTLPQLEQEMTAEITKRAPDAEAGDGRQHLAEYLGPELAARFGLTDPGTVHGHD
jgi:hypothetical protein